MDYNKVIKLIDKMPRRVHPDTKKNLTQPENLAIIIRIMQNINHQTQEMPNGVWPQIENEFNRTRKTLKSIWRRFNDEQDVVAPKDLLKPRKKVAVALRSRLNDDITRVINDSLLEHQGYRTYREIQDDLQDNDMNMCLKSVFNYCKLLRIRDEDSHVKPSLTEHNKMQRLQWVLREIEIMMGNYNINHNMTTYVLMRSGFSFHHVI